MLNIIVCVKQVYDPEAPASLFAIDDAAKTMLPPKGSPPVISPYDENALEAALKIKDTTAAGITVLSLGDKLAKPVLQKTLAAGADELYLLQDALFAGADAFTTAAALTAFIKKQGLPHDLVICGRQAADTNSGLVGPLLAEMLGIEAVTLVRQLAVDGTTVKLEREIRNGHESVTAAMPLLVTVGSEIGELRMATVKATMAVRKKKVPVVKASEMGFSEGLNRSERLALKTAPTRGGDCEWITADSPEAAGEALAVRLKEKGVV
jgi:electron transfer flavoprotein beta subunit